MNLFNMDDVTFLQGICRDSVHPGIKDPFLYNGHACATNGKILALILKKSLSFGVPVEEADGKIPNISEVVAMFDSFPDKRKWLFPSEHQPLYTIEECDCFYLGCDDCNKLGVTYSPAETSKSRFTDSQGNQIVLSHDLLWRLRSRKHLQFHVVQYQLSPMAIISFTGGYAAIMGIQFHYAPEHPRGFGSVQSAVDYIERRGLPANASPCEVYH